jgi:hypothetical protein
MPELTVVANTFTLVQAANAAGFFDSSYSTRRAFRDARGLRSASQM